MESVKKWLSERKNKDGFYIHRSPPKVVGAIPAAQLRQWARGASEGRLERLVLAGQGRRLLTEAGSLPISHHLPSLLVKCDALHSAVENGSLLELQELLHVEYNRQKLVTCKDEAGVGLLHKAVYYDFTDITEWLVSNYPQLVNQRDSTGRTALHYAVLNRDEASTAGLLEGAGAKIVRDEAGRTPASYRGAARTLLTLPRKADMAPVSRKPGQTIKRHQIRIWCHDCDMARLQRIVWEGHGSQLLSEVSNQPVVKKFLEAVPFMMNTVRDIHTAVVQNDLEGLMRLSGDPVPPQILSSRDINNMTVMHKAAGLGHNGIMKYLAERYPEGVNDVDNDGRTPLHYAAAVRDEQHTFNTLVELGADESIVDNKKKTPGYYINRAQEIDKNLLKVIPDAPRTASSAYPSSWDWKLLDTEVISQLNKKSRRKNKGSSENISSKNNTNTISENTESRTMKTSSTHEFIKDLPELDESKIKNNEEEDENPHMEEPLLEETTENDRDQIENDHVEEENKSEASAEVNLDENGQNDDATRQAENEDPSHEDQAEIEEDKQHESDLENNADVEENQQGEEDDNSKGEENISDNEKNTENETDNAGNISEQEKKVNEENESTKNEGNINGEDDDDVQIPGDTNSEYSDIHLKSTAEASSKTGSAKRGNLTNGRNTQESLIEGIISGEAEQDSQDASITQKDGSVHGDVLVVDSEIDPEVTDLINTANMEMLATLVLNGEGARLLGRRSGNTELQAFLDNVPTYMQKIKNVHTAAKDGNIRNLQAALDRRKFAIARDPISANGATPLHVATIFGKTNIMKYLGGRFPETLSAVDFEGRTALHYAAALPDNGHYYSLLQQLGANSKDLDDSGNSAATYLENPSLLPLTQLLSDFGLNEDEANNMFSDKGTTHDVNGHMDIPVFRTDEGRYLAKSLGDPLIKGLTEVANTKPKDPIAFLASFLHNFPEREKPTLGTQESNMVVSEEAEVENDQPPQPERGLTATRPRPIEVVTVDPQKLTSPDAPEAAFSSSSRDEHGQSMLHFAAARTHTRNALFQLLQESDISLGYRDELYRTARDVSIQANMKENTVEIDRFVLHLAARGNTEKIMELLLEGYDHILDTVDEDGLSVTDVVALRGDPTMGNLIASIPAFEESRESLHGAVRRGSLETVSAAISAEGGRTLARGQNSFGRTALHVAVLAQHEHIVEHLCQTCPELLRIGDNLERTPLHYAMGIEKIESISRVLIRAGAKRVLKDLKGRQPTYYFMNKSDILRLKEEEEVY